MASSAARIIAQVRENATDVKTDGTQHGKRHVVETGHVASSIAGAKIHACRFTIYRWLGDDGELGPEELSLYPACGTTRSAGQGGRYQNYYGIQPAGTEPTCAKCAKK